MTGRWTRARMKRRPDPLHDLALPAIFVCMALMLLAGGVRASEWRSWCGESDTGESLGWHFYCDREEGRVEDEPEAGPVPAAPALQSATARIEAQRAELEELRAQAILDPTAEKVGAYLRAQRDTLQRAAAFSDVFRRAVWATPDLDYTLVRPVGALAKHVWSDERRQMRDAALAKLNERYGLIYLAHADCGACKVFGPLLRAFAMRHGLDVLAVSMTGAALEGWPEAVPDNGRAARLGLADGPFPATVLYDTETRRVLPVAFGILAEDGLAERIFVLTQLETGHDY